MTLKPIITVQSLQRTAQGALPAPFTLPMPESQQEDAAGNVTFSFRDPLADHRQQLKSVLGSNVQQQRNRAGAYAVIADPGAALATLTWQEVDAFAGALRSARSLTGVLVLPSYQVERRGESFSVVLYRADALYVRGTGEVQRADG